jgi:hypothetical protein
MACGQGVGTAAAISAKRGISPRDVDWEELRAMLNEADALI